MTIFWESVEIVGWAEELEQDIKRTNYSGEELVQWCYDTAGKQDFVTGRKETFKCRDGDFYWYPPGLFHKGDQLWVIDDEHQRAVLQVNLEGKFILRRFFLHGELQTLYKPEFNRILRNYQKVTTAYQKFLNFLGPLDKIRFGTNYSW